MASKHTLLHEAKSKGEMLATTTFLPLQTCSSRFLAFQRTLRNIPPKLSAEVTLASRRFNTHLTLERKSIGCKGVSLWLDTTQSTGGNVIIILKSQPSKLSTSLWSHFGDENAFRKMQENNEAEILYRRKI